MIGLAVIQIFLVSVYTQEPAHAQGAPPMVIQFALARCFHPVGKGSSDENPEPLKMIDCQAAGSRMASTLHILRAGLLGRLHYWPVKDQNYQQHFLDLIKKGRDCSVTNILSPMIADTRHMADKKPKLLTSSRDGENNISVGQFVFESRLWQRLIPLVRAEAIVLFGRLLQGKAWHGVYSVHEPIRLDILTPTDGAFLPAFTWTFQGLPVSSCSLQLW